MNAPRRPPPKYHWTDGEPWSPWMAVVLGGCLISLLLCLASFFV